MSRLDGSGRGIGILDRTLTCGLGAWASGEGSLPSVPNDVAIVTLTRYPDIFEHLAESVRLREGGYENIVVTSGGAKIENPNRR